MRKSVARLLLPLCMLVLAAQAAMAAEQAIDLATPTGTLAGTLNLPAGGKVPVVLLVSGSGPTDRDGNGPVPQTRNDSIKLLAAALADAGFASVRYDKRGIAASRAAGPAESALRFDTYVDDAAAWVARLKGDPRFGPVIVLGHSEGSLVGMLAAQRAGANAYVSIAGLARNAGAALRTQLADKLPPDLLAASNRILAALERGATDADVPPALAALYRPSVQPYLISWMKYVPAERIVALRVPVLVVQGTTDIQVGVDEAQALAKAKPDAVLAIIPGMNHVLKEVPDDPQRQMASYGDPSLPLHPKLAPAIVAFLRGVPAVSKP